MYLTNNYWPRPGSVISVLRLGYRHYAIVSDYWDESGPMVISFEPCGLRTISISEFAPNNDWRDEGYWSDLPEEIVLDRALAFIGAQYALLAVNCEHHVRYAHNMEWDSPQVTRVLLVAAAMVGVVLLANR